MDIQKLKGRNGGKPNSEEIKVVKALLKEVSRVSGVDEVQFSDRFRDLRLNCIQKRDICVNVEMIFGIDTCPKEFQSAETVGELAQTMINNFY